MSDEKEREEGPRKTDEAAPQSFLEAVEMDGAIIKGMRVRVGKGNDRQPLKRRRHSTDE
ncbi:hypothetical protein MRBLMR1_005794 [Neorhizobium sp. LMR1-1-1.1]